jgi:hypothetical protein
MKKQQWIPEICYEDAADGITSSIPFISVPPEYEMPPVLFIFESRETNEFEPGPDGEEIPIVNLDLFQYANLKVLQRALTAELYDEVRIALGLDRLEEARRKGREHAPVSTDKQGEN